MKSSSAPSSCADILRVMGDPTRLKAVLQALLKRPFHVGDLVRKLRVEQTLISHHLKILRQAGLVLATRDGKAMLYSLAPEVESAKSGLTIDLGCCLLSFE